MSGIFDQIINYSPPLIVSGTVNYKGTWNASTNNPTLNDPPATSTKGDYYVVSTAGTQFTISFAVGDWIISNGTGWEKVDLTDAVSSVFGRTGAVVGVSTDYSSVGLTNTAIGASNPSTGAFTTVTASSTIAATGAVTGSNLSGTNTGDQTISITGDATASGSTGVLTATVSKINGTALSGLATGILKNTTTTGVPSIAVAADFPTLNQNTTGSAATLTTARGIYGNNFDGSAALTQIIASTYGGTGNGFAKFSGPASSEKTFTLPNASSTLLYDGGALGTPASGTVTNLTGTASININGSVGATTPSTGVFTAAKVGNGSTNYPELKLDGPSNASGAVLLQSASANKGILTLSNYILGGSPQDLMLYSNADNIVFYPSGALRATISSTGLAVTGALSATNTTTVNISGMTAPVAIGKNSNFGTYGVVSVNNVFTDTGFAGMSGGGDTNLYLQGVGNITSRIAGSNVSVLSSTGLEVTGVLSVGPLAGDNRDIVNFYRDGTFEMGVQKVTGRGADWYFSGATNFNIVKRATYGTLGGTVLMTVDASGNVGIGTSSPAYKLDVSGTLNAGGLISANGGSGGFPSLTTAYQLSVGTDIVLGSGYGIIVNGSRLFAFNSTGLAVTGSSTATGGFSTTFNASVGTPGYVSQDSTDTSGAVFIRFNKSNGTSIGSITRVTTTDAVIYNTTSDARLKENLRDFTDSGRLIDSLKPRVFDWKNSDENGKNVVGFIAQEEHAADPIFAHIGAVTVGDEDPETITKQWQRSDSALIPILVAELQSLRQRVAALENSN